MNDKEQQEQKIMQEIKKNSESSLKRKLKYGSVAMVFTIVFVAVMFVLNVVVTAINSATPMFVDMTKQKIYQITQETKDILSDVTEPIEIVFFMPMDMYDKNVYYGKMVTNCVKLFAEEFSNITIREIDIIKNPGIKSEFTTSELSQLATTSVAVRSQGKAKLLGASAFFITAESTNDYWAFAGERTLVSAILQAVSVDYPLVYYTTGHGEENPRVLADLFLDNGFQYLPIDLAQTTQEEINEAKILVICKPKKDFIGADPEAPTVRSEIDKVASFLNQFGSVMYFSSPDEGALPELDDLMKEYGMAFEHESKVVDERNSLSATGLYLIADYYAAGNVGDELTASIRALSSQTKTIVPNAKSINILNIASERDVSPVLVSSAASYVSHSDGTNSEQGSNNLLVVAQKTQYVDNNPKTSLFLVSGSYEYLAYLPNNAYCNSDIMLNAMRIMTNKRISTDIDFKLFDSTKLVMSMEEQNMWTLICVLLIPFVVSVVGVVVWLKRRHS